ncbi:MAG: hypothetical protein RSB52_08420 [Acidaminococcaceae bacterium]
MLNIMDNKFLKKFVIVLIAFLLGGLTSWRLFPRIEVIVKDATAVPAVSGEIDANRETTVGYEEKELLPTRNPDGSIAKIKEETDVELNSKPSNVVVKVNGKQQEFKLLTGETQKFEKGKVVLNQTSDVKLWLEIPTIDKTKNNAISYGFNSRRLEEIGYRHKFSKNFGYYVRGEGKIITSTPELKEGAAGLEWYF